MTNTSEALNFKRYSVLLLENQHSLLEIDDSTVYIRTSGLLSPPSKSEPSKFLKFPSLRLSQASIVTPYFNPAAPLYQILEKNDIRSLTVVTSSQKCNGFFGAAGLPGTIPSLYDLIKLKFLDLTARPILPSIQGLEYVFAFSRERWTFHSKALFLKGRDVMIGVFGSSNYGIFVIFESD